MKEIGTSVAKVPGPCAGNRAEDFQRDCGNSRVGLHLPHESVANMKGKNMKDPFVAKTGTTVVFGILCGVFVAAGTGCQSYARITWKTPQMNPVERKVQLGVADLSELKRKGAIFDRHPPEAVIGRHTFTVFAIPMGHINAHGTTPLKASFDRAVRDALGAAGYELVDAANAPKDAPILRGEVTACWWWSYTWLWPIVVQGGQNQITLFLEAQDGTTLWKRKFSRYQPGFGFGGAYGYNLMIKWSMTKLVRDIVRACTSEEFKAALRTG